MQQDITDGMNIGPRQQLKRLLAGLAMLVIGVVISYLLIHYDAHRAWRAVVAIPFWMGLLGIFQARDGV